MARRLLTLLVLLGLPAWASVWAEDAAVDCDNGLQCPAGNACLLGGFCAVAVDAAPGSVESKTTPGFFCEPGFREHDPAAQMPSRQLQRMQ